MTDHTFLVTVSGCTAEQADTVMKERIRYEEEYGFAYGLAYEPVDPVPSPPSGPSWNVPVDAAGQPLLDDATVRTMWEFATSAEDMQARIDRAVAHRTGRSGPVSCPLCGLP